jgi:hypothetical protein
MIVTKLTAPSFIILKIHQPWIPFIFPGGYRIGPPVGIDSELGIPEPFRTFIIL